VAPVRDELKKIPKYQHFQEDMRSCATRLIWQHEPDLIIHCAGQPSHELSGKQPLSDFEINTVATVELLEAARSIPKTPFIFMSTSKVYNPNYLNMVEEDTRFSWVSQKVGINEFERVDQLCHTPYGASKLAADVIVQEYGIYYKMPTVCFRCSCIVGEEQKGVALHGYLSHLCRCALEGKPFTIYGDKGKQVRDNLHVSDLIRAFHLWAERPITGVFNMGGGEESTCSLLEAIRLVEGISGKKIEVKHGDVRVGDHTIYYSDTAKFRYHYGWQPEISLKQIVTKLLDPTR
jgi:CDP-paratose 2-epimerase